ncbi:MAG: aspartyl/asparaginyl beta-hydroxylase domain-containing protein, partial [Planctomycetota bacterium]
FSYLAPQTHVYPHVDNDRPYMYGDEDTARCHLGLVVPTGSPIRIGGVLDEYREGHFHAFDARRHVHEVGNRSNEGRINLCVEVKYRLEDLAVPPGHGTARATER